jgi:hypothetical protein
MKNCYIIDNQRFNPVGQDRRVSKTPSLLLIFYKNHFAAESIGEGAKKAALITSCFF